MTRLSFLRGILEPDAASWNQIPISPAQSERVSLTMLHTTSPARTSQLS